MPPIFEALERASRSTSTSARRRPASGPRRAGGNHRPTRPPISGSPSSTSPPNGSARRRPTRAGARRAGGGGTHLQTMMRPPGRSGAGGAARGSATAICHARDASGGVARRARRRDGGHGPRRAGAVRQARSISPASRPKCARLQKREPMSPTRSCFSGCSSPRPRPGRGQLIQGDGARRNGCANRIGDGASELRGIVWRRSGRRNASRRTGADITPAKKMEEDGP